MDMNNNEVLFWKVIHNKYLFKKITCSIGQVVDNVLYNNCLKCGYQCYGIENKDKFKYIHSLSWMVNNGQFELLKWKLQTHQYIQINLDSLKLLVGKYPLQSNIFSLLLEKKRTLVECLIDDLKSFIIAHSSDVNVTEHLLEQLGTKSEVIRVNNTTITVSKTQDEKFHTNEEPIKETKVTKGAMELPLFNQYSNAIETCDIDKIKELDSIPVNLAPYDLSETFYKLFKNNSIQQIEQLTDYWYSNNYNKFSEQTFGEFIERVIYQQRNHEGFSNIRLNLNQNDGTLFQSVVLTALIELIKIDDFKSISLIFDVHSFKLYNFELFASLWVNGSVDSKYLFDGKLKVHTNNFACNEIIEMVNFWIDQYNTAINGDGVIESFSIILNHLYSTFIQIKMVKLQDILIIRKLIEDCGINIHHSLFHSFYYLLIRSPLLIKYILGSKQIFTWCHFNLNYFIGDSNLVYRKEIGSLRNNTNNNLYNCSVFNPNDPLSAIERHKFTFELVLGSNGSKTYDELLLELLSSKKAFENSDIEYLLDINRMDILLQFFEKLNLGITKDPSERLLKLAFKSLNSNSTKIMLKHYNQENSINQWFRCCSFYENKHIIKYMFENYGTHAKWETVFSNYDLNKLNLISIEFIFSNYSSSFQPSSSDIFLNSFIKGNMELCDLLLKHYPNHFTISNSMGIINPILSNYLKNKHNK